MSFLYTQSDLSSGVNRGIQNRIGLLPDAQATLNAAVRELLTEIRLRSTKRKAALVPNLFSGEMEYTAAQDLHADDIIDIPAQAKRYDGEFTLVPVEQFLRDPRVGDIAVNDANGLKTLLVRSNTPDSQSTIDPLSDYNRSLVDTWNAFGVAIGVENNSDDFVKGSGSIEFAIGPGVGTTAGIYNTGLDVLDLAEFIAHDASAFVYSKLASATGITNFKLHLGSGPSDYFEYTTAVRNDGTAFTAGWNLLRFGLLTPTATVGSPNSAVIDYVSLFMTKTEGKVSEAGYMFNNLVAKKGKYHDILYYSKYGWQSAAGAYKENSTDPTDVLVADTNEFDLFVKKGICVAAREADLGENAISRADADFDKARATYLMANPSEDKVVVSSYYEYD
jgi:hypothetical protein